MSIFLKFRTFWETHKIWKNLPHGFDKSANLLSKHQNHKEDFFKLCVLLKKSKLYFHSSCQLGLRGICWNWHCKVFLYSFSSILKVSVEIHDTGEKFIGSASFIRRLLKMLERIRGTLCYFFLSLPNYVFPHNSFSGEIEANSALKREFAAELHHSMGFS